jgi:hypothetical protein
MLRIALPFLPWRTDQSTRRRCSLTSLFGRVRQKLLLLHHFLFFCGNSHSLVNGPFRRKVDMEQAKFRILPPVSSVHSPQRSAFSTGVLSVAFGIAITLLNCSWLWKLWARKTPRTCLGRKALHCIVGQMAGDLGRISGGYWRTQFFLLLFWFQKHIEAIF